METGGGTIVIGDSIEQSVVLLHAGHSNTVKETSGLATTFNFLRAAVTDFF